MGVSGRVIGMWGQWYVGVIYGGLVVYGGKWDAGSVVCCGHSDVGVGGADRG